jgi:ubiquinone/menaquinone biosynthesis C-methylase UbiE
MTFDKKWETKIYKQGKQINQYPYDLIVSFVNKYYKRNNLKSKNKKALDLGCGTGNNLKFLCEFGFKKVVGVDGSAVAVKLAKKFLKKNKNCKILMGDFKKLIFKNKSIDLCIDRGSVTHNDIISINKSISEIRRVLKTGGLFLSVIFSKTHSSFKKSKKLKNYSLSFAKETNIKNGLITNFFTKKEIINLYKGFKILSLVHDIKHDVIENKKIAMWQVILKKK